MKLKCPACGEPVAAANINVQTMTAVCPACDNVFRFDTAPARRARKVKQPAQFTVRESDDPAALDVAFKWSWRTEPPLGLAAMALLLTVGLVIGIAVGFEEPSAALIPLLVCAYPLYYALSLAVNSTHFESDGETLTVETRPLYFPRYGKLQLEVGDLENVSFRSDALAELHGSGKQGFYNVYARMRGGAEVQLVAYVNYEHATFITQELNDYLHALEHPELNAAGRLDTQMSEDQGESQAHDAGASARAQRG